MRWLLGPRLRPVNYSRAELGRGALGVDDEPRNGFERIGVSFRVTGDAPAEKLREVVDRARMRSAVYDMVTNGVPVAVDVATS